MVTLKMRVSSTSNINVASVMKKTPAYVRFVGIRAGVGIKSVCPPSSPWIIWNGA